MKRRKLDNKMPRAKQVKTALCRNMPVLHKLKRRWKEWCLIFKMRRRYYSSQLAFCGMNACNRLSRPAPQRGPRCLLIQLLMSNVFHRHICGDVPREIITRPEFVISKKIRADRNKQACLINWIIFRKGAKRRQVIIVRSLNFFTLTRLEAAIAGRQPPIKRTRLEDTFAAAHRF